MHVVWRFSAPLWYFSDSGVIYTNVMTTYLYLFI